MTVECATVTTEVPDFTKGLSTNEKEERKSSQTGSAKVKRRTKYKIAFISEKKFSNHD